MNRIFISYRTSDAKKDAHRLAVDLERVFGDDQVFFDKHDLHGGSAWRDAIGAALGERPIVLVLVTPELVAAVHPEGGRRIDREDDPIRSELLTARQHGALVVPLLTEGVAMPGAGALPQALGFLAESHALKLRTDDWAHDLERLVADLARQGVQPNPGQGGGAATAAPRSLRTVWILFWVALVLWIFIIAEVGNKEDADTYLGGAVLSLLPLGMFIYAYRGLREVRHDGRWAALVLAVLCGISVFGMFGARCSEDPARPAAAAPPARAAVQRPPVTSITAPVV